MKARLYVCEFCDRSFKLERYFLKHKCEKMRRHEALQTPTGMAAWAFYRDWVRLKRRKVRDHRSFIESSFYMAFNRFAEFVKKTEMPRPDLFIKIMIEKDFPPTMWTLDETYTEYIQYLDNKTSPKTLVGITVDTLLSRSDDLDCDVNEIFNHISPIEVIELLRERKLTPWFLLQSTSFANFLRELKFKNRSQYITLETLITPRVWKSRFNKRPELIKEIKGYVKEMDL